MGNVNLSFSIWRVSLKFRKSGYLSSGEECGCNVRIDLDKENQNFSELMSNEKLFSNTVRFLVFLWDSTK